MSAAWQSLMRPTANLHGRFACAEIINIVFVFNGINEPPLVGCLRHP